MDARSDGQRQGGRFHEMTVAEMMQIFAELNIKVENGGGPVRERGGTVRDNRRHFDPRVARDGFLTTVQGGDRDKRMNTGDRAVHNNHVDLVGAMKLAFSRALEEKAVGKLMFNQNMMLGQKFLPWMVC